MTILIIIAILIVAGVVIYFLVKEKISITGISTEFMPIYNYYSSCIEQETKAAIDLAGSQGGYIYVNNYQPGSEYAPFSNQLNIFGFSVPYWYYESANGIIKEQAPSKTEIEKEIALYVKEKIKSCNFEQFYSQGFEINFKEAEVKATMEESKVRLDIGQEVSVSKEDRSAKKSTHNIELNSKFGKFYRIANEIYSKEKNEAFLENYTFDTLSLNAPVNGVEISCNPKIWKAREVSNNLLNALEANIGSLKMRGNYYNLNKKENSYFVINKDVDESINFIYSKQWPTKINIQGDGVDEELMIAKVVGNQEGLGVMGFCYAPYHFVYDISFPVVIQIYDNEELFQFPVAVIIDKNMPRKALFSELNEEESFDLCSYKTQDIEVNIYDVNLNSADANISFFCFDQECRLGESTNGKFVGKAPACVNGYVKAKTEGYAESKKLFSSNYESNIDMILDKEYKEKIELQIGGNPLSEKNGMAVVLFNEKNGSRSFSAALPEVNEVKISEGEYEVRVYVYGNSSITIPASKKTQCTNAPQSGILGILGSTKEQCYDIEFPETKIEYALIGGGKTENYFLPSELEKGTMQISVNALPVPNSLEQLQNNFEIYDTQEVNIEFK